MKYAHQRRVAISDHNRAVHEIVATCLGSDSRRYATGVVYEYNAYGEIA